jgi:hypothetical protein
LNVRGGSNTRLKKKIRYEELQKVYSLTNCIRIIKLMGKKWVKKTEGKT